MGVKGEEHVKGGVYVKGGGVCVKGAGRVRVCVYGAGSVYEGRRECAVCV